MYHLRTLYSASAVLLQYLCGYHYSNTVLTQLKYYFKDEFITGNIIGSKIEGDDGNLVFSGLHDELMIMVTNADKFTGLIRTGALRKQESAIVQLHVGIG